MEIAFRLTREDNQRFCQLVAARVTGSACSWCTGPPVLSAASVAAMVALGLFHRAFGEAVGDSGLVAAILAYLLGALSALLFVWSLQRRYLRHYLGDDSPVLAESRLRIAGDGLEATGAHATAKYLWPGIKGFTETADLVVVWIDRALGIVVPKRAFASDEACRSFVDAVRAHLPTAVTADPG